MALMMLRQQLATRDAAATATAPYLRTVLAAQNFIRLHYHRADLTADRVAAGVRCSRAHLFRAFATHGLTVTAYLRETRLIRAKQMLESAPREMSVGAIAWACGYSDLSAFGKAFRRRFGDSPNNLRRA